MTDKGIELPLLRSRPKLLAWDSLQKRLIAQPGFLTWMGSLVICLVLCALKLPVLWENAAPSGADPGNWLSLAWSLTGQGARLSPWAYPPMAFVLLRGLLVIFTPLISLKIFSLACWIGMTVALWFVLRKSFSRLPAYVALGIALIFGLATYNNDMFAWGGYPQMLGTAFLILALPHLEAWLILGKRSDGRFALLAGVGVIYTHHLMAALLLGMGMLVFAWTAVHERWQRRDLARRYGAYLGALLLLSLPAGVIYWNYLHLLAGNPANANGYSLALLHDVITYVFRDLASLWLVLLATALITPFLIRRSKISGTLFAFTWGSLLAFLLLVEVRVLQMSFAGIAVGLALLYDRAWSYPAGPGVTRARHWILGVGLAIILAVSGFQGQNTYVQSMSYYQVAGNDVLPGLTWLRNHTSSSDRVAVSSNQPGMLGWWVEGYAQRPAYYAADLRWLSFRQERENARIANLIFNPQTSPLRLSGVLSEQQSRYIFIDRKFAEEEYKNLLRQGFLVQVYADKRIAILKVR